MNIHRLHTREEARASAISEFETLVKEAQGSPLLLLFSGGSALELLGGFQEDLLQGYDSTIGVLDERYSKDPGTSNFAQLATSRFYQAAKMQGVHSLDTRAYEGLNFRDIGERFAQALKEWKQKNTSGKVIITQGIGEDGHTAGIMPYPLHKERFAKLFENADNWVVAYDVRETEEKEAQPAPTSKQSPLFARTVRGITAPLFGNFTRTRGSVWQGRPKHTEEAFPMRITVTLPFLRNIVDHSIVYAVGARKERILPRVLLEHGELWEFSARVIHEMKDVRVFTDIP